MLPQDEIGRNRDVAIASGSAPWLESVAGADLDPTALVGRRVLDECDQPIGHEPAGADRCPRAGHLAHFDHAPGRDHLDPPTGLGGHDVEGLDALTGIDDGLDSITLHGAMLLGDPYGARTR
jgi:hypothetical protein